MSVFNQLACMQKRRDEVPNQELADELARTKNMAGIQEIAEGLWNKDKNIQSDCLKVLYEIGYRGPDLIADYVDDFLRLLASKNNRLVWGGMIALSTIAGCRPQEIFDQLDFIIEVIDKGSVITVDAGVKTLATVAAAGDEYNRTIFPYLLDHLQACRPKDVPQHAESTMPAVNAGNQAQFVAVLNQRLAALSASQQKRVRKLLRVLQPVAPAK